MRSAALIAITSGVSSRGMGRRTSAVARPGRSFEPLEQGLRIARLVVRIGRRCEAKRRHRVRSDAGSYVAAGASMCPSWIMRVSWS
jgi:hypothetical protein